MTWLDRQYRAEDAMILPSSLRNAVNVRFLRAHRIGLSQPGEAEPVYTARVGAEARATKRRRRAILPHDSARHRERGLPLTLPSSIHAQKNDPQGTAWRLCSRTPSLLEEQATRGSVSESTLNTYRVLRLPGP